jgi:F0F1-type ATP synthase epsilon subunit
MNDETLLELTVKNRQKTVFQGNVHTVSSSNEKGVFDILPFHANYITLVKDSLVIDKTRSTEQQIPIDRALLYVMDNKINVYAGL